ncbi:hypothetical protein Cylst_4908 [Cylindrospermum stagnale PCC 7417]|uniref:SPOR domain-containing protein n=1 Tax=Cylindrospermum stagnale PCC 7417 TaxID=56107 RepID=K9X2U3_9NOST|nr:hypothetical protein [Cylindrospermum stagnale]AFZ26960.1 hypothetical protein Cylst_4908 [Cylindrospermum stagnale PCC 7417]
MSQNPLIDSGTQSSKTPGLKPALGAALASLEVQLDQELTRYRRTRSRFRTANQSRGDSYINSQPQQLTDMSFTAGKILSPVAENQTPAASLDNSALAINKTEKLDHLPVPSLDASTKTQTPPPPPPPRPKSSSSIVPAVVKTPEKENLLQPDNAPNQPDDYLESSEALLRSLTEEQPETKKPSNTSDSLLSPLGIGSILLLLVASLTLGYVVFNPKNLPQLKLANFFSNSSSPTQDNTEGVTSNPQPIDQPELTSIPKYPNLAAKEFPEVRDPSDVVGLKPKIQPTSRATPKSLTVPQPINQTAVQPLLPLNPTTVQPLPPLNQTTVQPLPPLNPVPNATAESLGTPTANPPQVNSEIKPAGDGFYHIVIDNQGDRALAAARQVVPDAYLSRNQKYIYLAAMKTKAEVEQRLQQLQAKGVKARIQQP